MTLLREPAVPRMARVVEPEVLDWLSPDDPQARRSRRDLRRINRIMRSGAILASLLRNQRPRPQRVLEIGAGDGTLMLELARRLARHWPRVEVTLLDRHDLLEPRTRAGIEQAGWRVRVQCMDALDWAQTSNGGGSPGSSTAQNWDLVLANLFIHHLGSEDIGQLFAAIAARSGAFIACEPRRQALALWASRLLPLIGANAITRRDAVASVRAGFCGLELTQLWPAPAQAWQVQELEVGPFSHCFLAQHKEREAGRKTG